MPEKTMPVVVFRPALAASLLCALCFLLVLCLPYPLRAADNASGSAEAGAAAPLRVALLLEHADSDNGRTAGLRAGLARAERDFGLQTAVLSAADPAAQAALFTQAAGQYDLVLVADAGFHEILRNNAANFRKTMFGCIDAGVRAPNIMSVTFADEQAAYLAGVAAAAVSAHNAATDGGNTPKSSSPQSIGWISADDTPAARSLLNGFAEGARFVNPEIRVINTPVNPRDPAAGRAAAEGLLAQGAGVLVAAAGRSNAGVVEAVRNSSAYLIGLDTDMHNLLPGRVPLSILRDMERAVYDITAATARKAFRGKEIIVYDLANNGVDTTDPAVFAKAAGKNAPPDLVRRLNELRREIISGAVRIKSLRERALCDCI